MQCVHANTITTIDELRSVLETVRRPLTLFELRVLASRLRFSADQWQRYLTFDPRRFSFRAIYSSPHFEINLIGWRSGQFSSLHDHRGTACCVLVLDGVLTNVDYGILSSKVLKETSQVTLRPGQILSRSGCEIHRCGNDQPYPVELATLHLYSPPLRPLSRRQYHQSQWIW